MSIFEERSRPTMQSRPRRSSSTRRAESHRVGALEREADARVPLVDRHPSHVLLRPLVEPEAQKGVERGRLVLRLAREVAHVVELHGDEQVRIGLCPVPLVFPIVVLVEAGDVREEGVVLDDPLEHALAVFVLLPADGLAIESRSRDRVHQALPARAHRRLEDVPDVAGLVLVQLVDDRGARIEPSRVSSSDPSGSNFEAVAGTFILSRNLRIRFLSAGDAARIRSASVKTIRA